MNKVLSIIVVLVLIVAGYWYLNTKQSAPSNSELPIGGNNELSSSTPQNENVPNGSVVKVSVTGSNFAFSEKEIKVKKGDIVEVTFLNSVGTHDFVIDEFKSRTKILKAGESETIKFVADKTGTFEYYCSVGSHRAMGMKGNLIVE